MNSIPCNNSKRSVVALEPQLVRAEVWQYPKRPDVLECYISAMVSDLDPWLEPVYDLLSSSCSRETHRETTEDPDMFFGEARRVFVELYDTCPGQAVDHNCLLGRTEHLTQLGGVNGGSA